MLCTIIRLTSTLCFLITGASVGCCQGTNPQPQAAADENGMRVEAFRSFAPLELQTM